MAAALAVGLAEVLAVLDLGWSAIATGAVLVSAVAATLPVNALLHRLAGRQPNPLPADIGIRELAAFVAAAPALRWFSDGWSATVLSTAVLNVVLVTVLWAVIGFGVVGLLRWSARRVLGQLGVAVNLLARAIPLLLLFAVVLFVNTEMWQVFSAMSAATLAGTVGLLVIVGCLFLTARLPREVAALEAFVAEGAPLRRLQRLNVALVLFVSQGLQVLVVTVAISAFFAIFGLLTVTPDILESWTGTRGDTLVSAAGVRVTRELVQVAIAIGALAGLYYAIAVFVDPGYREEFLDDLTDYLTGTFRARESYLRLLDEEPGPRTS